MTISSEQARKKANDKARELQIIADQERVKHIAELDSAKEKALKEELPELISLVDHRIESAADRGLTNLLVDLPHIKYIDNNYAVYGPVWEALEKHYSGLGYKTRVSTGTGMGWGSDGAFSNGIIEPEISLGWEGD